MFKRFQTFIFVLLLTVTALGACGPSDEREIVKNEYYDAIEKIYPLFKQISNKTKSSQMSFEGYKNVMKHAVPEIEKTLNKYKKSEWADKTTFVLATDLLNNYVEAQGFWKDQKGLHLVAGRFDRGKEMIKELEAAFDVETGRKLTKE